MGNKKLPCSGHADEQEREEEEIAKAMSGYSETNEDVVAGDAVDGELELVGLDEMTNRNFLVKDSIDQYEIDLDKIETIDDVKKVIKAMNIVFTQPNEEMLQVLKKVGS